MELMSRISPMAQLSVVLLCRMMRRMRQEDSFGDTKWHVACSFFYRNMYTDSLFFVILSPRSAAAAPFAKFIHFIQYTASHQD